MGPTSSSTSPCFATSASVLSKGRYASAAGATRSARAARVLRMLIAILLAAGSSVALPGGEGGIGFDDLGFGKASHRVIAPAGRTGKLDLIDPSNRKVTSIGGFTVSDTKKGHGAG